MEEEEEEEGDGAFTHDYVFRVVPLSRGGSWTGDAITSPASVGSNLAAGEQRQGGVSSRLVALSSLSARLKDRFLSLSSSPTNSPPPTPKSATSSSGAPDFDAVAPGDAPARLGTVSSGSLPHGGVHKRHSEPVFSVSDRESHKFLPPANMALGEEEDPTEASLKTACDSMRFQIISRAFYGWLAHCRHLKTIREHLSCLVERKMAEREEAEGGLTREKWAQLRRDRDGPAWLELCRLIYFGGIADENIRAEVTVSLFLL